MSELTAIARLPQVKSAVLSDAAGGLLDVLRNSDGESVAAVVGFLTSALTQASEHLGLGRLRRVTCLGGTRAWLVVARGDSILTAFVDPPTSISMVEEVLDGASEGR
jgi:hypothetical protein